MSQTDDRPGTTDDALGAERALDESVREAAESEGRARRESDAEDLTEATHGVTTEDGEHSPPPAGSGR